jgi:NitT/TauT family transport system substrate-binding protein
MRRFLVIAALLSMAAPVHAQKAQIVIGSVPSPTAVGTYIAIDKGYFRDLGIEVDLEPAQSAGAVMAMLASNRIQVVEGGMAASYWNAITQGMPTTRAAALRGRALRVRSRRASERVVPSRWSAA